jgi:hypothetical protein
MINMLGATTITIPVIMIEWAPKNWSKRDAWGPEAVDGFYLTKAGEIYRLQGNLVIYVTEEEYLQ